MVGRFLLWFIVALIKSGERLLHFLPELCMLTGDRKGFGTFFLEQAVSAHFILA